MAVAPSPEKSGYWKDAMAKFRGFRAYFFFLFFSIYFLAIEKTGLTRGDVSIVSDQTRIRTIL